MSYLSASTLSYLMSNPEGIGSCYNNTRSAFLADLGDVFANQCEDHLRLAFCSVVAFDLKPYGGSTARSLRDLMAEDALDCDNYVALAWQLFLLMRPLSPTKVAAVGWNGGVVGNHAQMQARTSGSPDIYLDPTIGLVVFGCSLDSLCKQYPFQAAHLKSFWTYNPKPPIAATDTNVRAAILGGQYKASDLLYFAPGFDNFQNMGGSSAWATPQSWSIA